MDEWDQELKSLWLEYSDRADLALVKGRTVVMVWDWYVKEINRIRTKYAK